MSFADVAIATQRQFSQNDEQAKKKISADEDKQNGNKKKISATMRSDTRRKRKFGLIKFEIN